MEKRSHYKFSHRIQATPPSMIREILRVTEQPDVISFAGGLPSPDFLDIDGIRKAADEVLEKGEKAVLQYSTTEGYRPLREWIAKRYRKRLSISVDRDEILITNGSQQTLDLVARIFIDEGDPISIEAPGYLGAIQAFSQYMPVFHAFSLRGDGPDITSLVQVLERSNPKILYTIPNSQNPSGITYTTEKRKEMAAVLQDYETILLEDDAYGEISFSGTRRPTFRNLLSDNQTVLLGSFSKIVAPGFRLGWLCAPPEIIDQATIAKQASDLHTNIFVQHVLARYLEMTDMDERISSINRAYHEKCSMMLEIMDELFPERVSFTRPDGGMFIWLTLPDGLSAMDLWRRALENNVAILPGTPFYTDGGGDNGVRLNFSNEDAEKIEIGISRLAAALKDCMNK